MNPLTRVRWLQLSPAEVSPPWQRDPAPIWDIWPFNEAPSWRHTSLMRRFDDDSHHQPGRPNKDNGVRGAATRLTITVPDTVDAADLQDEIVTAVADRLRDDQGYELLTGDRVNAGGIGREYRLHPGGSILIDSAPGTLVVRLHDVRVDANDLFTGVSSELEQRHEGVRVDIG